MNGKGRDDAFLSECVERYSDMVFRLAYQYLFNRQDAEDVVQDVFFALVRRSELGRFNGDEHVKAWLIRVTVNKSINAAAYLARRRAAGIENRPAASGEEHSGLEEQLGRLSPSDRQLIYLHYYEGYTAKEIAGFIGLRENAVHKRLSRARQKLKNYLTEED